MNHSSEHVQLSQSQMGIYAECMQHPGEKVYDQPFLFKFSRKVNLTALQAAIQQALGAHPNMYCRVTINDEGMPVQYIDATTPIEVPILEVDDIESVKHTLWEPMHLDGRLLTRLCLIRTPDANYMFMQIHHLIFDGTTLSVLFSDIENAYHGGHEFTHEDLMAIDFARQEAADRLGDRWAADRRWYEEHILDTEVETVLLPDLEETETRYARLYLPMKADVGAVTSFCKQHGVKVSNYMCSAFALLMSRYTSDEQVLFTTIWHGRRQKEVAKTCGMFVSTVPLYYNLRSKSQEGGGKAVVTVGDLLEQGCEMGDGTRKHALFSLGDAINELGIRPQVLFAYQGYTLRDVIIGGEKATFERLFDRGTNNPIGLQLFLTDKGYELCVEYMANRYSEALIRTFAESLDAVISQFCDLEKPLSEISITTPNQLQQLDAFNQNTEPYDEGQTIVSLFRQSAQLHPDNLAVVYQDRRYTYREVDEISDRLAACLVSKGLKAEDVVSILIPRCEWMAIASLGVLKAGCAYQPLDPTYPAERLNFMIEDASARLLIADEELRPIVDKYQGDVLFTKDIPQLPAAPAPEVAVRPENLFILLYTSGSTGVPKGCQLEHRNLVAFCHWYQRCFELSETCHVAAYASYGFDACMMDLYPALTCGACVHIIGEDIRLNLPDLNDYFNAHGITHSFITTQVGYQFATNVENHSLRCFAVGGEKLSALNPPTNYKMYNGYGPTECTIFTTNYWVKDYELDIPIGKPLDNLRLYIVDKQFNRLPIGAAGELWVSGPQVSRGYLNRPEKTAETYLKNPFCDDPKHDRVYRTGDIVRYLPDGNIQFVGRKDGQVKIRGFRIEMKEVEAVIRQFPGIKDVTVQAFDYENGGKYIAAYIVSDEKVDIKQLNAFIGQQKPPYMIPAATMQIDSIPLNQNQKVNRKALPAPVIQAADREYVAPVNDIEKLFCKIFGDILSMDKIGATDNFFELGGTSLMVTRVIIEADKSGHHIAYGDVFANPTPRQLANFLAGGAADEDDEARNYNYGPINTVLESNTIQAFRDGERQPIGNALITGATGFLGIHVLKELIDRDDVPVIWCMVRAENEEKAERRLKGMLYYYFSNNYKDLFGNRLRVINGDVTQEIKVDGKVDTVFNCAAVVKHFSKGTEIEDVNVGGAAHCVRFCLLNNARLIHISTYSTAGMSINGMPPEDTVYTEQKLYFGQNLGNQYAHSKFISERVVLDAVALHKLNAKVMRVGNLAPRSTDGEFQINFQTNSAMGRIRVYQMLGCYPYELTDTPMEFSPINEVAKAIVLLSETPQSCCLFHPFNNHYVHFGDVLAELSQIGNAPKQVENEIFNESLETAKQDPEKAKRLSSLLAYQDMAHGQKAVMIPTDNQYTTQVLYRLGFRWSSTSWDYVDQMLVTIGGFGYFD